MTTLLAIFPRVSIITVVYNARDLLAITIEAVSRMTYPAIEYIIIDGASTDGTLNVIERYRHRIASVVSEKDRGIYEAMNKGIGLATGEYLWFINAGDTPATPEVLDDLLSGTDSPDYVYGHTNLLGFDGTVTKMARAPSRLDWRAMTHGMQVSHQSFIARREIAPLFDLRYRYIADQKWIVDILRASRCGLFAPRALSNYLMGGLSHQQYGRCVTEKIRYSFAELGWPYAVWITLEDLVKAAKFYLAGIVRHWWAS